MLQMLLPRSAPAQSDNLLCGIAEFSRGNKNKLRTFHPQKWKKLRTVSLKQNLLVLIKKQSVFYLLLNDFGANYLRSSSWKSAFKSSESKRPEPSFSSVTSKSSFIYYNICLFSKKSHQLTSLKWNTTYRLKELTKNIRVRCSTIVWIKKVSKGGVL